MHTTQEETPEDCNSGEGNSHDDNQFNDEQQTNNLQTNSTVTIGPIKYSKVVRPSTCFMQFHFEHMNEIKKTRTEKAHVYAKLSGEKWRNMTEEQKKPFMKKSDEDKARYEREIEQEKAENGGRALPTKNEALKLEKLRRDRIARGINPTDP